MRRVRRLLLTSIVLAAAAYVTWGMVESRRLASAVAAIAARGEATAVDGGPAVLTPEQRQAARIYAAAVERLEEETREDAFRYGRLDADNPAAAAGALDDLEARYPADAASLQLLDRATPLDFAAFAEFAPELDRNQQPLMHLSARNALRADLLSMRGRGAAAADALVASVRLQRTLTDSFVRSVSSTRVLGSLRILLRHNRVEEPALSALQGAFEALPDKDTLVAELVRSRAGFLDAAREPARTPGEAIGALLLRPVILSETRRQLSFFAAARTLIDAPWPDKFDRAAAFEQALFAEMQRDRRRAVLSWLWPRMRSGFTGTSISRAAVDLAARRVAVSVLAVERFRRAHAEAVPDGLAALVPTYLAAVPEDPFSGRALAYTRNADDYRIYSVDSNRTDDGGEFYGVGSRAQLQPRAGAPRDFGIRVPRRPED